MTATAYLGDIMDMLPQFPENSFDSVVCDPPYNLDTIRKRFGSPTAAPTMDTRGDGPYARSAAGFMGHAWDNDIMADPVMWWQVLRVLKPGGHLLAFSHSRTYHRMTTAIEQAGFDIRDQIMWLYGSGFPKSHTIGPGWGTALKPAHEPICVARKPLSEKSVVKNMEAHGVGGFNLGDSRIGGEKRFNPPASNKPGGVAINMGTHGMPQDATGHDVKGRFPANVIHDGIDEDWARYFYCAKAPKDERVWHCTNCGYGGVDDKPDRCAYCGELGKTQGHPTVKPQKLMRYLVRLVTPDGGCVLDPFAGSGSTLVAARDEGFNAVGIEQNENYFNDINRRLAK